MTDVTWTKIIEAGVSTIPAPLPKANWKELYALYDEFKAYLTKHQIKVTLFNDTAKQWQRESGLQQFFSGYFSPYFRDTTNVNGKDNKRTIQFCEPYYRYLYERDCEILEIEPFRRLADALMSRLFSCFSAVFPIVSRLGEIDPALRKALMPGNVVPPIVFRLITYESDSVFATNPHVDKSAVTLIADTEDDEEDPRLVFGPIRSNRGELMLSQFMPVRKKPDESLIFLGAAPREAGFSRFLPAPHAVLPFPGRIRHVAIFFWLMPNVDLETFNTAIACVDDLNLARKMAEKFVVQYA